MYKRQETWLAGGNIAATNAEERSFSMFVFSGTENDRAACTVPPVPGQMLCPDIFILKYLNSRMNFEIWIKNKVYSIF